MLIAKLSLWRESNAARSATYAVQMSYCASIVYRTVCITHWAVLCKNAVSSVQRAVFSVQCVVCNAQCAVYSDQCAFWSVHCFELLNTACWPSQQPLQYAHPLCHVGQLIYAIQYNEVHYSAVHYSAVKYSAVQYSSMQFSSVHPTACCISVQCLFHSACIKCTHLSPLPRCE